MYVGYKNNIFHNVRSQSHWKCTYKIIFSLYISRYTMIKPTEPTLKKLAFSPVEQSALFVIRSKCIHLNTNR